MPWTGTPPRGQGSSRWPEPREEATGRLLVALSRVRPAPDPKGLDLAGLDPDRFLFLAGRLGNFSLLVKRLLERAGDLDPAFVARARRNLNFLELRERLVFCDVEELARQLGELGEPLLLLKGGAYSRYVYPGPGLRSFLDLDVLILRRALGPAVQILERRGYQVRSRIEGSTEMTRPVSRDPSGAQLVVELTTSLVHQHEFPHYRRELRYTEEALLGRADERRLGGARVRILSPEDELVYSVIHFLFHHDLRGLKYHSDLNALLTDPGRPFPAGRAVKACREARAQHAVGLTLLVHERLFGPGSVPGELLEALAPRGLRRRAMLRALPPLEELPLVVDRVAGHPAKALAAPGVTGPLRLLSRLLFPGRAYLLFYFRLEPVEWRWSYYLRYPLKLARDALLRRAGQGARPDAPAP